MTDHIAWTIMNEMRSRLSAIVSGDAHKYGIYNYTTQVAEIGRRRFQITSETWPQYRIITEGRTTDTESQGGSARIATLRVSVTGLYLIDDQEDIERIGWQLAADVGTAILGTNRGLASLGGIINRIEIESETISEPEQNDAVASVEIVFLARYHRANGQP